jgi:hypothetical protein
MEGVQFFTLMFVGAGVLAGIIAISKVHDLMWIPVISFMVGYLISNDASYRYPSVLGGLTFCLFCSFLAGIWYQRQKTKG